MTWARGMKNIFFTLVVCRECIFYRPGFAMYSPAVTVPGGPALGVSVSPPLDSSQSDPVTSPRDPGLGSSQSSSTAAPVLKDPEISLDDMQRVRSLSA